ncbi:MAG: hypothetical protein V4525_04455 [Pseudomonadota bacterium]
MKHVAFLTSNLNILNNGVSDDDALAIKYLTEQGLKITPVIWNNTNIDWNIFDLIVIRSCWDYHLHLNDFISLLNFFEKERLPVHNSPKLVKWNLHKKYLLELSKLNIPILKTSIIEKNHHIPLNHLFEKIDSNEIVIKPAVSLGGQNTFLIRKKEYLEYEDRYNLLLDKQDVLVQEFYPEIFSEGEYSFVFFEGQFSHAIVKKASTDFRIHTQYGGIWNMFSPSQELIEQAKNVLEVLHICPLYARVDAILRNGILYLIELELTDPRLYFLYYKNALVTFSNALNKLLK